MAAMSSSNARRASRLTPGGLARYGTRSPVFRNRTPWNRLGRNPLPQ